MSVPTINNSIGQVPTAIDDKIAKKLKTEDGTISPSSSSVSLSDFLDNDSLKEIFKFCRPTDLLRLSEVNRKFSVLAKDDKVWEAVCKALHYNVQSKVEYFEAKHAYASKIYGHGILFLDKHKISNLTNDVPYMLSFYEPPYLYLNLRNNMLVRLDLKKNTYREFCENDLITKQTYLAAFKNRIFLANKTDYIEYNIDTRTEDFYKNENVFVINNNLARFVPETGKMTIENLNSDHITEIELDKRVYNCLYIEGNTLFAYYKTEEIDEIEEIDETEEINGTEEIDKAQEIDRIEESGLQIWNLENKKLLKEIDFYSNEKIEFVGPNGALEESLNGLKGTHSVNAIPSVMFLNGNNLFAALYRGFNALLLKKYDLSKDKISIITTFANYSNLHFGSFFLKRGFSKKFGQELILDLDNELISYNLSKSPYSILCQYLKVSFIHVKDLLEILPNDPIFATFKNQLENQLKEKTFEAQKDQIINFLIDVIHLYFSEGQREEAADILSEIYYTLKGQKISKQELSFLNEAKPNSLNKEELAIFIKELTKNL